MAAFLKLLTQQTVPKDEEGIKSYYNQQKQALDGLFQRGVSSATTKRNLVVAGASAVGALALTPIAWAIATTAVSAVVAAGAVAALAGGALIVKIRLPVWLQKGYDRAEFELIEQRNLQQRQLVEEQNRHLTELKIIAAANPIETRQNIAMQQAAEIDAAQVASSRVDAFLRMQEKQLRAHRQRFPSDDVLDIEADIKEAREGLVVMRQGIENALRELGEYNARTALLESRLVLAAGAQSLVSIFGTQRAEKIISTYLSDAATNAAEERCQASMSQMRSAVDQLKMNQRLQDRGLVIEPKAA